MPHPLPGEHHVPKQIQPSQDEDSYSYTALVPTYEADKRHFQVAADEAEQSLTRDGAVLDLPKTPLS